MNFAIHLPTPNALGLDTPIVDEYPLSPLIMKIETDADGNMITFSVKMTEYGYNFDIDWGDGVVEHYDNKIELSSIPHT